MPALAGPARAPTATTRRNGREQSAAYESIHIIVPSVGLPARPACESEVGPGHADYIQHASVFSRALTHVRKQPTAGRRHRAADRGVARTPRRKLDRRELLGTLLFACGFVAAATALAVFAEPARALSLPLAAAFVGAYIARRPDRVLDGRRLRGAEPARARADAAAASDAARPPARRRRHGRACAVRRRARWHGSRTQRARGLRRLVRARPGRRTGGLRRAAPGLGALAGLRGSRWARSSSSNGAVFAARARLGGDSDAAAGPGRARCGSPSASTCCSRRSACSRRSPRPARPSRRCWCSR